MLLRFFFVSIVLWATACGDDATPPDAAADSGAMDAALCVPPGPAPNPMGCAPAPDDWAPANGAYDPCISDDGRYVPIEPTISTVGRVRAFEDIAALLFDPAADATPAGFSEARRIYQEDEGLDSRVVRRYDPHFAVPTGTDCTMAGVPEAFPDFCVGPAQLQPSALAALNAGIAGDSPRLNAGRLEGTLLWFLYVSTYKESVTCTTRPRDCDSSWAYYTGGEGARCGVGLSRYVAEADPHAHDRAWDGALALRCWRDLDPGEVASDLALGDRARAQYDRATLHGVAAIVRGHLERAAATTGDEQAYHWGAATTLGRALDREMTQSSPSDADVLSVEIGRETATEADIDRAIGAINAVFTCP